jgi:hypothetical protein
MDGLMKNTFSSTEIFSEKTSAEIQLLYSSYKRHPKSAFQSWLVVYYLELYPMPSSNNVCIVEQVKLKVENLQSLY